MAEGRGHTAPPEAVTVVGRGHTVRPEAVMVGDTQGHTVRLKAVTVEGSRRCTEVEAVGHRVCLSDHKPMQRRHE